EAGPLALSADLDGGLPESAAPRPRPAGGPTRRALEAVSRPSPLHPERVGEPLLRPVVVGTGAADGNAENLRCLFQGQLLTENELDDLALPPGEPCASLPQSRRVLGARCRLLRIGRGRNGPLLQEQIRELRN